MNLETEKVIIDVPELRNRPKVFRDREHAGEVLGSMFEGLLDSNSLVLGIPSGGVPVALVIARLLRLNLDIAVANKITPHWNTELGYGAIAFDGTEMVRQSFITNLGLSDEEVKEDKERTRHKVQRRNQVFRKGLPFPNCNGKTVIIVDDGLATGVTMQVAVEAIRKCGPSQMIVAVPTGHLGSLKDLAKQVDKVYCPNVREDLRFAVAEAYEQWSDLNEYTITGMLNDYNLSKRTKPSVT